MQRDDQEAETSLPCTEAQISNIKGNIDALIEGMVHNVNKGLESLGHFLQHFQRSTPSMTPCNDESMAIVRQPQSLYKPTNQSSVFFLIACIS